MLWTPKKLGSSASNEAGAGVDWTNPTYALAVDGQRSSFNFTADDQVSDYLVVSGFGFTVPSNATILGIEVELVNCRNQGSAAATVSDVQLRDATGDNTGLDASGTEFATNDTVTLGGSSELWTPTRVWTYSAINAATFAVAVKMVAASSETTLQTVGVDAVRVRIAYSTPDSIGPTIGRMGIGI